MIKVWKFQIKLFWLVFCCLRVPSDFIWWHFFSNFENNLAQHLIKGIQGTEETNLNLWIDCKHGLKAFKQYRLLYRIRSKANKGIVHLIGYMLQAESSRLSVCCCCCCYLERQVQQQTSKEIKVSNVTALLQIKLVKCSMLKWVISTCFKTNETKTAYIGNRAIHRSNSYTN